MLRFNDAERLMELSVHDVVEAGPRSGHLNLSMGFAGRHRLAEGIAAHQAYQGHRKSIDETFDAEVTIRHRMLVRDWEVVIRGRMDGLTQEGDHYVVEEVKSSALGYDRLERFQPSDMPDAELQLQMYLHALAAQGKQAAGRLILISILDGTQHVFHVSPDPDFEVFLIQQLEWMIERHESQLRWSARRRNATIPFAHSTWRPGQEELASDVEEIVERGGHVLLNAPTGLGKTAGVLHAAIRTAYRTDQRIFFATARTTQQRIVEDTVRQLARAGLPIRAVSIRAREKACLNEVLACRPDCCPYAHGHHDRVREASLPKHLWSEEDGVIRVPNPEDVSNVSVAHTVCPFALSMELAKDADIIIGDYNYLFDPSRRIGPIAEGVGDWIVVVDEAHNLPDRARGYASPVLGFSLVQSALDGMGSFPQYDACSELIAEVHQWLEEGMSRLPRGAESAYPLEEGLNAKQVAEFATRFDELGMDYALLKAEQPVFEHGDPYLDVARIVSRIRGTLERAGDETVVIWRNHCGENGSGLSLLCRDPSPVLSPTFADLSASVIMSATLRPVDFYAQMLGLEAERTVNTIYESPFPPENRLVLVTPNVSTEYRKRERDKAAIAAHIEAIIESVPGNIAVFFSSFALRDSIAAEMGLLTRPVIFQERSMEESDREKVLKTMAKAEGHVLFAVLGGIFSEGIDLPGDGLVAAVIVGPALPAVCLERKLMSAWFQEKYGHGFRYAYQVPGMARVVQAAGRVIRSEEDVGAIVLMGRRFLQTEYQAFFPPDWEVHRSNDPGDHLVPMWSQKTVTGDRCGS